MAKKKKAANAAKKPTVNTSIVGQMSDAHLRIDELLQDPDLMEFKFEYKRDDELEFKALLDADHNDQLTVIHAKWDGDTCEFHHLHKIPYGDDTKVSGCDPAYAVYDVIKFSNEIFKEIQSSLDQSPVFAKCVGAAAGEIFRTKEGIFLVRCEDESSNEMLIDHERFISLEAAKQALEKELFKYE